MTTRTGAALSDFDAAERIGPLPREQHTYCIPDQVDNPSLRAAMSFFDDSLVPPMQPYLLFLNCCQAARDPGADQGFFAGHGVEFGSLLSHINDAIPGKWTVVVGEWGAGKSAIADAFALASQRVRFDADVPTRLHLTVRGMLNASLAARAAGTIVGAALGFVLGSASVLTVQAQDRVPSLELVSEASADEHDDAVDVVRNLQHSLGIDLKDVLAAASIKSRTYHSWTQPSAPRPRLASQGRLWALAQLVDDLQEILDVPIRQWLLAEAKRLLTLRAGCFDELLEQASQERVPQHPTYTVAGPFHGVGEHSPPPLPATRHELIVDEQAITEPVLPPRGSSEPPQV